MTPGDSDGEGGEARLFRAESITVVSPEELMAVPPPGAGTVNVRVESSQAMSPVSPDDHYTYVSSRTVLAARPGGPGKPVLVATAPKAPATLRTGLMSTAVGRLVTVAGSIGVLLAAILFVILVIIPRRRNYADLEDRMDLAALPPER